jgi:hypothetical protein
VSLASKLQPTIAVSTTEAEYMAAAAAIKEALWLRVLLKDLDHNITGPMIMYGDNQGAIKLLKNPVIGPRSKHIDVVHHFARERVMRGEIDMCYIPTDKNMADAFTKPLPNLKFAACCSGIGTVSQPRLPAHVLWCTAAAACFKLHSGRRGLQQRWPDLVQGGAAEQPATHMRWHKHGKHQAGTTKALLTCLYGQRHTGLALSGCSASVPSAARLGLCCTNTPSTCLLQPGGLACARATSCKQTGCQTPGRESSSSSGGRAHAHALARAQRGGSCLQKSMALRVWCVCVCVCVCCGVGRSMLLLSPSPVAALLCVHAWRHAAAARCCSGPEYSHICHNCCALP